MTSRRRGRRRRSGAETTLTIAATICFLPCICVIGGGIIAKDLFCKAKKYERPKTRMKRQTEERRKELLRTTPRPLEPRLERHLTIGREVLASKDETEEISEVEGEKVVAVRERPQKVVERTDGQMESPLFKLPLEIRRQIWEETMGGYVFHIYFVEAYRRMSHTRCKTRSPEPCKGRDTFPRESCRANFKVPGARDLWGHSNMLSILQSCRRIYSETIEMLYEGNTFDFDSLGDVLKFSLTVLPDRMRLIKDVQWKPMQHLTFHLRYTPWLDCQAPSRCHCITCWRIGEPGMNAEYELRTALEYMKVTFSRYTGSVMGAGHRQPAS